METQNNAIITIQKIIRGYNFRKKLLTAKYKKQKMKKNFLKETLQTERTYFNQLDSIVKDFLHPLLEKQIVSEQTSQTIFSNVQLLRDLHLSLLEAFETRHKSELFTYGDIFEEFVPYLILYTDFVNNFDISRGAVESEKKSNVKFSQFLESNVRYTNCKLDLHSLLITPVQRIPRYIMLIEGLLKNLDPEHLDYPIFKKVLIKLKVLAIQVNKNKYKTETFQPLFELDDKFRGLEGTTLIKEGRQLIKMGHLIEKNHPNPSKSWIFLFNDCIIFATNEGDTYQFRFALPLSQITLQTSLFRKVDRTNKDFYNFLAVTNEEGIVLTPKSQEKRNEWVSAISKEIIQIKKAEKSSFDIVKYQKIQIDYKKTKPKALYGHACCIIDEYIYIFGGEDIDSNVYNDLYYFDLENGEWKIEKVYQGESPEPRTECSLNIIGTYLFLFGGTNKKTRLGDFHIFLTETGEWINEPETTGTQPTPRSGHASAVIENQIWIFGGRNDEGVVLNDLYCLDCNTYTWFCVEPANNSLIPSPRVWHTAVFIDTNFVVYGGWSNGAVLGDLWIYDLLTSEWYQPEYSDKSIKPPIPRYSHTCTYVPQSNRMYVIGGNSNNGFLKNIVCFHLKSLCWEEIESKGLHPNTFSKHSACHIYYNEDLVGYSKGGNIELEEGSQNESNENNKIMSLLNEKKKNYLFLFGGIGQNSSSNELFSLDLDFKLGGKRKIEEDEEDRLFFTRNTKKSVSKIDKNSEQTEPELIKEEQINNTKAKKNDGNGNGNNNNNNNGVGNVVGSDIDIEIEIENSKENENKVDNKKINSNSPSIQNLKKNNEEMKIDNKNLELITIERGLNFFDQLDQVITNACDFENKLRDIELEWRKKNQGKSFKSSNYTTQSQILKLKRPRKSIPKSKKNIKNSYNKNLTEKETENVHEKITPIRKNNENKEDKNIQPTPKIKILNQNKPINKKLPSLPSPKRRPPPIPPKRDLIVSEETKIRKQLNELKQKIIQNENAEKSLSIKLNDLKEVLDQYKNFYNDYLLFSGYSQCIPLKFYKKNTLLTVRLVKLNTSFDLIKNSIEQELKRQITIYYKANHNSNSNSNSNTNNKKIERQSQFEECLRNFEKSIRIPIKFLISFGRKIK
ncbi:hypothetical protein M0813_24579 [Anaeramoeba flamelloides]|uniref:DH domain-containing protein n=1 Tax=Anaeramoeba flamelloides TaxID=1746091 RepID=A0ABQ8Y5Y6_9EUKA|nr:hypothetical protein M0813_24579 [Anaeramoeba flamelloides]